MTIGLYLLRAAEFGLKISDLEEYTIGELTDMMIEKHNDTQEYPQKGTNADIKRMFGGKHGKRLS